MIKLENISFSYPGETILSEANLTIEQGKITVVLGKNGVGKTTLLSLIDGYLTIDSGHIHLEEDAIYIYDQPHLYDYLSGREYIELIKSVSANKTDQSLDHFIEHLQLTDALDKMIHAYSLGMKHKLALLTALMVNYQTYLIDEPLASLDPESQALMITFFKAMKEEGKTLVISTHMLEVAYELADDIVFFNDLKLRKIENSFDSFKAFKSYVLESLKVKSVSEESDGNKKIK